MPLDRLTDSAVNGQLNETGMLLPDQIHRLLLVWTWQPTETESLRSVVQRCLPATQIGALIAATIPWSLIGSAEPVSIRDETDLIARLAELNFDAALIFTQPAQSPYRLAYCCYLAGIPIRIGQSAEFGGTVLSHSIQPLPDPVSTSAYHIHLLESVGLMS